MKSQDVSSVFAHFPKKISKGIVDFARDTVFLSSRYIFTRRVKDFQYGYCTHCRQEFLCGSGSVYLRHNESWQCHKCKSLCIVKASGRGRKYLRDDAYFVYYEKSIIDPNAIVAWGLYAVRDYSSDYCKTETHFQTVAMYLFQPGKSTMLYRDCGRWVKRKTVRSESRNSMRNKSCYLSTESVVSAVHGTPFQYSTWEKYTHTSVDLVEFFDLAAKYPCVEYLTKLGLHRLIEAKLLQHQTYGVVNWRGKSLEKVLRISKSELKDLHTAGVKVNPLTLYSFHFYKRHGMSLSFKEAHLVQNLSQGHYLNDIEKLSDYAPLTRIIRYILKQLRREDVAKYYSTGSAVFIAWKDYIRDCRELGMDLGQEHVLYPNNLYIAHQKTIEKVKIKKDEKLNTMIAKRLKSLQKYAFEYKGLFIRPAQDSNELFEEGKALKHCVGRYSKSYAEGETNLFVIRKTEEPDTPFYTMEIRNGNIVQCRGFENCTPTEEVKAFISVFTAKKLLTKKRTRVEVAV